MNKKFLSLFLFFSACFHAAHCAEELRASIPNLVEGLPDTTPDEILKAYNAAQAEAAKKEVDALHGQLDLLSIAEQKEQTKTAWQATAASCLVIGGVAATKLAAPMLQRSISTRIFGIDDAAMIAGASLGGKAVVSAVPWMLATIVGAYGVYKIHRLIHAGCRSQVDAVKYEMRDLLRQAEESRRTEIERLIRRYDGQIEHMERHIAAAKEDVSAAAENLEAVQTTLEETKMTNEALKAKMAQALPLIQALAARTERMAASAHWDLEATAARLEEERRTGAPSAAPAPRKKKPWWKF